jgi:cyclic pyranopterin phosphate synthase
MGAAVRFFRLSVAEVAVVHHNPAAMDPFGRHIDYLRISVTDRCNERCLYCMPEGYKGWAQRVDHLTADEIVRIAAASTELGFRKFRLTGGEPLVRADIVEIARRIWDLPGVQTLGISTNGLRLADLARPLKQAGVRSINISLDTLDATAYRQLTGGSLAAALDGIHAAAAAGFECVKLNSVLLRGFNEHQIIPLIEFGAGLGMPVRFIELMPLAPGGPIDDRHFFPVAEAMKHLAAHNPLDPAGEKPVGHGPARYFRLRHSGALVGFIGSITCADFCETCNKLRLTADGKLRPCLGRHGEIDLLAALRPNTNMASALPDAIHQAIANKPENHSFADDFEVKRPMIAIGG